MSCCPSCGSDVGLRTRHLRMVRGSTLEFTHVVRDEDNRPVDLTGAKAYLGIRADIKVDPSVKLTSDDPAPSGWRIGIVFADQTTDTGELTVTIIPADTSGLVALGHDDPWFYDLTIKYPDDSVSVEIATSQLDIYPQITNLP